MIQNDQQYELAEDAIHKMKQFLLAARQTHSPEAYALLSKPILLELQERERDILIYLSEAAGHIISAPTHQK
jgi:hypothetical protein